MQATGKPLVSSRHMHTTTLVCGHFGPTRAPSGGYAEPMAKPTLYNMLGDNHEVS